MLDSIFWLIILVLSLFTLIKSADYFITYAEKIGIFFGLPCFVIGIIILSVGTSLPELVSSIIAVMRNSSEIVLGNVIGSNIANILLVLGATAFWANGFRLNGKCIKVDLVLLLSVSIILLLASFNNIIGYYEGIFFLVLITAYIYYTTVNCKSELIDCYDDSKDKNIFKNFIILIITCYLIYIGSDWTIKSVINLSEILKIPKEFIAITIVAIGTSLPELVVTISAVRKGNVDMALGNILGSCIFNSLGVVGVSALFGNLSVTENLSFLAFPVMFLAVIILIINSFAGNISRVFGGIYLAIYLMFIFSLNLFS